MLNLISFPASSFVIISIILLIYLYYKLTIWKRQQIPNIISYSLTAFRSHLHLADQNCIRKYGDIVGTYEILRPVILIAKPELISQVLISKFKDFSDHRAWLSSEHPLAEQIMLLSYKEWKVSRVIISHAFSTSNLRGISYIFENSINTMINKIKSSPDRHQSICLNEFFDSFTLEVLLKAFYGINIGSNNDLERNLRQNTSKILNPEFTLLKIMGSIYPIIAKISGVQLFDLDTCNFFIKLMRNIIDQRKEANTCHKDLLQYLLDAENNGKDENMNESKISTKEIISNGIIFLIVGSDTTTGALLHSAQVLATNPLVQEKLFEDINRFDCDEKVFEEMKNMPYLDLFFKELLRLYPTGTRIERKSVKNTNLDNIFIPKDSYVIIPIYAIHRDPNNFENPNQFIPERFLPENIHKIRPGTYIPFANGPRNCVGMRFAQMAIKLCIVKLVKKFQFVECDQTKILEYSSGLPTLKPKQVFVKVVERN